MSKLRNDTARLLQKAVRMEAADDTGVCECVTCSRLYLWKRVHAGHFVGGRSNGVLFDERNIHVQCVQCNHYHGGNLAMYLMYMLNQYGEEVVEEIRRNRYSRVAFERDELMGMREWYRMRITKQEKRLAS